jgi:glutathione S-transferase
MFLEETGTPYKIFPVNIGKGEQFKAEFLAISPNNRIPAMIDHDPPGGGKPVSVFESGAMLVYLAEKTGKFLPTEPRARADVMQWLFWQMGGLGPMSGQNNHFSNYATDKIQYAMDRYRKRGESALRGDGQAPRRSPIPGRRVFDRRHGELSLGDAARAAAPEDRRLPASEEVA